MGFVRAIRSDRYLVSSVLVIGLAFLCFLLWAGFVPLAEGTAVGGRIEVEVDRQVVQHLEGGIIRRIFVEEGQAVASGDALVVLEDLSARTDRIRIAQRIASLSATVQRLDALLLGHVDLQFEGLDALGLDSSTLAEIELRQARLLQAQRDEQQARISLMETQQATARQTARLTGVELESTRQAATAAAEELSLARGLLARQMGRIDTVRRLEGDVARLNAEVARLQRAIGAARSELEELQAQAVQGRTDFVQSRSQELVEAREALLAAHEELAAADDVVNRAMITAPLGGTVLNLRFSTEGGIVRPGEALLEIVPESPGVVATVRIPPNERAQIAVDMQVRASITAYRGAKAAPMPGIVESVSADLKVDPNTSESYYEAVIRFDQASVADIEILPGMPVQAFIFSGRRRTTLDYILSPLFESLFKGLRTQ